MSGRKDEPQWLWNLTNKNVSNYVFIQFENLLLCNKKMSLMNLKLLIITKSGQVDDIF